MGGCGVASGLSVIPWTMGGSLDCGWSFGLWVTLAVPLRVAGGSGLLCIAGEPQVNFGNDDVGFQIRICRAESSTPRPFLLPLSSFSL